MIQIKNVNYTYEKCVNPVLSDINASLNTGKMYAIIGKSGSGKTTLLSLISGLDVASQGEILFNEKKIKELDRDNYRAKNIGVIFQSYNLLTNATAIENIELSMNISQVKVENKRTYAYELLERVGINQETANRKILKLSGGEQQRVAIARAISHDPDLIIADEPTGNLDVETEKSIMTILSDLSKQENKCVIIVTHSKKVSQYADDVFKMEKGRLKVN